MHLLLLGIVLACCETTNRRLPSAATQAAQLADGVLS